MPCLPLMFIFHLNNFNVLLIHRHFWKTDPQDQNFLPKTPLHTFRLGLNLPLNFLHFPFSMQFLLTHRFVPFLKLFRYACTASCNLLNACLLSNVFLSPHLCSFLGLFSLLLAFSGKAQKVPEEPAAPFVF